MKKEFDLKKFKTEKVVVHCKTENEANDFFKFMGWGKMDTYYSIKGEDTCYCYDKYSPEKIGDFEYCDIDYYKRKKYEIIEWSDYMAKKTNTFTKNDLKTGMIVEARDGSLGMVLLGTNAGDIISGEYWCPLDSYNSKLLDKEYRTYDIMKVYQHQTNMKYLNVSKNFESKETGLSIDGAYIIWEREEVKEMTKEEIEEILGYKIKIIE